MNDTSVISQVLKQYPSIIDTTARGPLQTTTVGYGAYASDSAEPLTSLRGFYDQEEATRYVKSLKRMQFENAFLSFRYSVHYIGKRLQTMGPIDFDYLDGDITDTINSLRKMVLLYDELKKAEGADKRKKK